jgi:hypothetical protein
MNFRNRYLVIVIRILLGLIMLASGISSTGLCRCVSQFSLAAFTIKANGVSGLRQIVHKNFSSRI